MSPASPAIAARVGRVNGGIRASFRHDGRKTTVDALEERDGYRMRMPCGGLGCEGVLLNTGGGVVGGDRVLHCIYAGERASVAIATPAAERIYRSSGESACISVDLTLKAGSTLAWLPQETILYDNARLVRDLSVDMPSNATALLLEITVFGRRSMCEAVANGLWTDRWRVRRDGRLIFAENNQIDGPIASLMGKAAIAGGGHIIATSLYIAPDAESHLAAVRMALGGTQNVGASAWNGLLCIRAISNDLETLRSTLSRAITTMRGAPMPRVWGL